MQREKVWWPSRQEGNNATYSNFYLLDDFLQAVVVFYGIKSYVFFSQEFSCALKNQKKG